jgi:predicted AAA+ superfamily ATPase
MSKLVIAIHTGSGRLDYYRFGGDSLQGRYHLLRLHPLSVAELRVTSQADLADLLTLGGFPEPFWSSSEVEARRWSRDYRTRLIREDVAGLERLHDLGHLELLMLRLPDLAGSPLSINAVREDLQVAHKTVANWLDILERLYAIFRLAPFGAPRIRAVKKEHKWVHFRQDTEGLDVDLRYFRDHDRREVDFVVVEGRTPVLMVECKLDDAPVDPGLRYLKARFPARDAWQIHAKGTRDYQTAEGIHVAPAVTLLKTLV